MVRFIVVLFVCAESFESENFYEKIFSVESRSFLIALRLICPGERSELIFNCLQEPLTFYHMWRRI